MRTQSLLVAAALAACSIGCTMNSEPVGASTAPLSEETCGEHVTSILAGQYLTAGTVVVSNDASNLYVTAYANTADGWAFRGLHLYAGAGEVPVNPAGTPVPGAFPYAIAFDPPATEHTFVLPLEELEVACGETLTLALHTESVRLGEDGSVVQEETGWGYGTPFEDTARWGWSFTYEPCCEPETPEEAGCTLTQGYWKTHNAYATRRPLRVDWPTPYDEDELLCDATWLQTLQTAPAGGDAWTILAHQYIAASLNVANGASTTAQVDAALADAEAFLIDHCGGAHASEAPEALELAAILDAYNNGLVGPGHCG